MGDRRVASMSDMNGEMARLTVNDPRRLGPSPSTKSDGTNYNTLKKSLPDLRTPSPSNSSVYSEAPPMPPPTNPYTNTPPLPPLVENGDSLLVPPPPLTIPSQTSSPPGSRPGSRAGRPLSRPISRDTFSRDRPLSRDIHSRDGSRLPSRAGSPPPALQVDAKLKKRRSWMPGSSPIDTTSPTDTSPNAQAWLITARDKIPYDLTNLINFRQVNELWDNGGDTLVYLHNNPSGPGASFRVKSECFATSRKLTKAAYGQMHSLAHSRQASREFRDQSMAEPSFAERAGFPGHLSLPGSRRVSADRGRQLSADRSTSSGQPEFFADPPERDIHLCLPQPLSIDPSTGSIAPNSDDQEVLVTVRNLFAFLTGLPLLATTRRPTLFSILMHMSNILTRYEFTNYDGSSLGEEATSRFEQYLNQFNIGDVRTSREQTIEAILLGERMKCWDLYNEGFVHAVGKYADISNYKSLKTGQISELSRKRLERSHMFLSTRLRNVRDKLQDFEFPGIFAGFANSTSTSESKTIHFKTWRVAFQGMRKHVLDYYKHKYGHWPPKARSKKNNFEESGLNRLLLRSVYQDLCDLYDVLADRSNLTTRHVETAMEEEDPSESLQRALRRILGEYDRSTPPIQPPIPFDVPWVPSLSSTRRDFNQLDPRKQKKECLKKLKDSEINTALMQSYNRDLMKPTPFLEAFFAYERRLAANKCMEEIADQRIGQWLFMYAVIQALPLVVIDAPGLKYTEGVEYFLSEFSKESPPWLSQTSRPQRTTWRIPGSDTMVDMPAASVEHSLDAIYQRSHCWTVARIWAGPEAAAATTAPQYSLAEDELLPPVMPSVGQHSRSNSGGSPDRKRLSSSSYADRRLSMGVTLEHLPLPSGVSPTQSRPTSVYDPSKSFNSILGLGDGQADGKGGKKKK